MTVTLYCVGVCVVGAEGRGGGGGGFPDISTAECVVETCSLYSYIKRPSPKSIYILLNKSLAWISFSS